MKTSWIVVALACIPFVASDLLGQMQWSPMPQPPGVYGQFWAYDSRRDRVVATAATLSGISIAEFDGQTWISSPVLPPQAVWMLSVGFDEERGQVVWLGENQALQRMETWRWNGLRWVGSANQHGPSRRVAPMAFHAKRRTLMMFGGLQAHEPNELWEWNGRDWHPLKFRNAPPAYGSPIETMAYTTLAYDIERDEMVVFGRTVQSPSPGPTVVLPETWVWNATLGWRLANTTGPAGGSNWLVYDSWRRTLVLSYLTSGTRQTWERRSGGSWILRSPTDAGALPIYDSRRGRTLVPFAQYAPNLPADFTTIGAGCPGTLGTPSLELTEPWTRAWFGDVLSVTVRNLPQSAAILATGFSTQATGGITLPADLGAYGMPGCFLRVAVDDYAPLVGSNGSATHARTVPSSFAVLGLAYHQQAIALDPAANAFGATMSNAVTGHVGQR